MNIVPLQLRGCSGVVRRACWTLCCIQQHITICLSHTHSPSVKEPVTLQALGPKVLCSREHQEET